jgi:hypothetical protein
MKITIDDTEHEVNEEDQETMNIVNLITLGNNSLQLIDHIHKCVSSVQQAKVSELKSKLTKED